MPFEKDVTREIYHLRDWVFEYPDLSTIDGRPGLTVLARRLANAVVASVLAGFLWTLLRHLNGYLAWLLPAVAVGVVVFVLVFAASVLWQRIHIAREDNAFVVRQVLLLPRLHSVPLSALQGIDVFEQELRSSLGIGGRRLGCGWRVLVRCQDHWVEFWCDHGRDEDMLRPFPPRVAEFVEQLHRITGLPCPEQPIASHAQQQGAHRVGQTIVVPLASETHRQIYKSLDEMPPGLRHVAEEQIARTRATGERQQFTITDTHTYRTLDEMPPELRHVAEQQIARAGAQPQSSLEQQFTVTVTDSKGHVQTYHTLDEMPPDLRRVAEEQAARARTQALTSTGSQEFTISDSEGRVHTYHTLDEMPPELRTQFEAARRYFRPPGD